MEQREPAVQRMPRYSGHTLGSFWWCAHEALASTRTTVETQRAILTGMRAPDAACDRACKALAGQERRRVQQCTHRQRSRTERGQIPPGTAAWIAPDLPLPSNPSRARSQSP